MGKNQVFIFKESPLSPRDRWQDERSSRDKISTRGTKLVPLCKHPQRHCRTSTVTHITLPRPHDLFMPAILRSSRAILFFGVPHTWGIRMWRRWMRWSHLKNYSFIARFNIFYFSHVFLLLVIRNWCFASVFHDWINSFQSLWVNDEVLQQIDMVFIVNY